MHIIKPGDVVTVVNETTKMTVAEINDDNVNKVTALCYWFKKDSRKLSKEIIPLHLLRLA